jgi:hypothetical protein
MLKLKVLDKKDLDKKDFRTKINISSTNIENVFASKLYHNLNKSYDVIVEECNYSAYDFIIKKDNKIYYIELKTRYVSCEKFNSFMIGETKIKTLIKENIYPLIIINYYTPNDCYYIIRFNNLKDYAKYCTNENKNDLHYFIKFKDCFNYNVMIDELMNDITD